MLNSMSLYEVDTDSEPRVFFTSNVGGQSKIYVKYVNQKLGTYCSVEAVISTYHIHQIKVKFYRKIRMIILN